VAANADAHTFSGSCATFGTARTAHPLTPVMPTSNGFTLRASGTCTGMLDGERLPAGGAPVELASSGPVLADNCFISVVSNAPFTLRFAGVPGGPKTLHAGAAGLEVSPVMPAMFTGARGGVATGFDYLAGGAETVQACLAGEVQAASLSSELYTLTPLVG